MKQHEQQNGRRKKMLAVRDAPVRAAMSVDRRGGRDCNRSVPQRNYGGFLFNQSTSVWKLIAANSTKSRGMRKKP
ncbi:TPA: hypothetical protein QDB05_004478 [Burkholderia vietnamiensis]|uniref:hypothetical protein n=1 Tax=Burkholderia vietnamiensis TaxID=60552 RepID=UPI0012D8B3FF|nr:hypothetical protein [Burkholderia vietnamiensis]HDR9157946.1 hypothetical protein [Burkholderia vietnamiensis]